MTSHRPRPADRATATPTRSSRPEYDAIVVGARVAGAATAMLLARAGHRVLLVDRGRPGTDVLSTHALMRGGVRQLYRWGLLDRIVAAGTPAVRATTFNYADGTDTIEIRARDGVDALYAPRRTVLDPVIVAAAEAAGAEVRFGLRVEEVLRDATGRVTGVAGRDREGAAWQATARMTIGADGLRSTVADQVGAATRTFGGGDLAYLYAYWPGLPDDAYVWDYRSPDAPAGIIPTNDGLAVVFVGVPRARFDAHRAAGLDVLFHQVLRDGAPETAEAIRPEDRHGPVRGWPGEPGMLRTPAGPGWALVGDAGYFKDPLTAHGITDALIDAEVLARAASRVFHGEDERAAMLSYAQVRDEIALPLLDASGAISRGDWDAAAIRGLLIDMSRAMKAEEAVIDGFERSVVRAAA